MSKRPDKQRARQSPLTGREEDVRDQMRLLKDSDPGVRIAAIGMLGSFGASAQQSIPRLLDMLFHEEDSTLLESLCQVLIEVGADPMAVISRMVDGLRSLDPKSRVKPAELLARFGEHVPAGVDRKGREALLPGLLAFVRDNTQEARARCAIIRLLGEWELKPTLVSAELADLLDDDDDGVRKRAMQALEHFRPASVAYAPTIIRCLRNRPGDISWYYAEEFFRFVAPVEEHADSVASALIEGLRGGDAEIREMCASVLGELGAHADAAISVLCEALKDETPQVRREAAESLGNLGAYALRAVPALMKARHQSDLILQAEADEALRKIAPDKFATIVLNESFADRTKRPPPIRTTARYLGDRRCQVGDEPPFTISEKDARVLEALIELRTATKPELSEKSGVVDAARGLGRIRKRFPQLAAYIVCPGRKGKGGYSTTITRG